MHQHVTMAKQRLPEWRGVAKEVMTTHDDDAYPLEVVLVLELVPQEAGDRGQLPRVVDDGRLDVAQLCAACRPQIRQRE